MSHILNLLWDLVVHPANHVRVTTVKLFDGVVRRENFFSLTSIEVNILSQEDVGKRVVPALVTMSSDPDKMVQFATIRAFANVAANVEDSGVVQLSCLHDT
jgi:hypothetical protein